MATSTPSRLATAEPAFRKIWNRHYSIRQLCDKKADEVYISPQHGMLAFVVILFGSQWGRSDVAATFPRPHCDIAHKSQEGRKGCKLRGRSDIAFRQQCDFYKSPNGFSATQMRYRIDVARRSPWRLSYIHLEYCSNHTSKQILRIE